MKFNFHFTDIIFNLLFSLPLPPPLKPHNEMCWLKTNKNNNDSDQNTIPPNANGVNNDRKAIVIILPFTRNFISPTKQILNECNC